MKTNVENHLKDSRTYELSFQRIRKFTPDIITRFQKMVYTYYREYGRIFPWRETTNPYRILVSEAMLQQTQTDRVVQKYHQFVTTFPDFYSLAHAPLQKILEVWHGLGYNRRAVNLKRTAEIVVTQYHGVLPSDFEVLQTFPGIGKATAGAITAFAFNEPTVFIETNIRTVYIHFFFQGRTNIKDKEILPLVEKTLDYKNPREWYYALMDYGVMLKRRYKNINKKSFHYHKQTPFQGSNRQMRGKILKVLIEKPYTECELVQALQVDPERVEKNLKQLEKEGFIKREGDTVLIV